MAEYFITIVARSVRLLPAKTFTPLVNCIVNGGQVSAMSNMQKTLLQLTTPLKTFSKIMLRIVHSGESGLFLILG